MMDTMLDTAMLAARAAGDHILAAATRLEELEIEQKKRFDYVTQIDRESELIIRDVVHERYPSHEFIGEEYGASNASTSNDYLWIVDPLDGTTNFVRGIAHYAVSIALVYQGELIMGVVFDPAKDEMFHALQSQGCFLNGQRIRTTEPAEYAGALLSTGVPFNGANLEEIDAFTHTMKNLLAIGTSGIRRLGSAALDLAYVAAGRYDGFWEANLKPWDIAAGVLLVKEAGGLVSDFRGEGGYLKSGDVVAAPHAVYEKMLAIVGSQYER